MKIIIYTNKNKDIGYEITNKVKDFFIKNKCALDIADIDDSYKISDFNDVDFSIAVGGDGTFLQAAKKCINNNIPIAGINLGRTGFLAQIPLCNIEEDLNDLIKCNYSIEKRMMIELVDIYNNSYDHAINDIIFKNVIGEGVGAFKIFIDDCLVSEYRGDGVLVSAPTGATAYSLSLGGPIVNPKCELMIIQPIAPHSLKSRSIIVNKNELIKIKFDNVKTIISIDGKNIDCKENELIVKKSENYCNFINLTKYNFYSNVYEKIK